MNDKKYVLCKQDIRIPMQKGNNYARRYAKPGIDVINEEINDFFPQELATFSTEEEVNKELSKYESSFSYGNNTAEFNLYYYEEQNQDGELDGDQVGSNGDKVFYIAYYMNLKEQFMINGLQDYPKRLI